MVFLKNSIWKGIFLFSSNIQSGEKNIRREHRLVTIGHHSKIGTLALAIRLCALGNRQLKKIKEKLGK